MLATCSNDMCVKVLRLRRGSGAAAPRFFAAAEMTLRGHDGTVRDLAFSPIGDVLASAGCARYASPVLPVRAVSESGRGGGGAGRATTRCGSGTAKGRG